MIATPEPIQNLTITVNISETGDVIASSDEGNKPFTMSVANSGSEIILLNLTNDGVDEPNSTITVRVTGCTGVTVADDCEVVTTSSNTASTVVADDEVPKISISGPTSANDVVGNNPNTVTYTLEANPIPHQTINIKINITQIPNTNGEKLYVGANSSGNQTRTEQILSTRHQN